MFNKTFKVVAHVINAGALGAMITVGVNAAQADDTAADTSYVDTVVTTVPADDTVTIASYVDAAIMAAQMHLETVSDEDRYCLQQNIYFEARNQSIAGQVAVAWVTLNRVEAQRFRDTICGVVWQNKQFSWTHDGKSDSPGTNVLEQRAWEDAGLVADVVLLDWARRRASPVGEAIMYHADYVNPYWAASYTQVAQIESHIFYE
jgi:spore germination cell wall hydrolase CwlJ-like protein